MVVLLSFEQEERRRVPWPTRRPTRQATMVTTAVASVAIVTVAATSRVRRAQTIPRCILNEHSSSPWNPTELITADVRAAAHLCSLQGGA